MTWTNRRPTKFAKYHFRGCARGRWFDHIFLVDETAGQCYSYLYGQRVSVEEFDGQWEMIAASDSGPCPHPAHCARYLPE